MLSALSLLLFCQLLIVTTVNCDKYTVATHSGLVQGVSLRTLEENKEYIAYRGIPYAEPPVGDLRFRVPVPIAPWEGIYQATDYGNSCLVLEQSIFFPWNHTQSEDCLYLNVFTPVTSQKKLNAKKAVMFFIHGGAFTEGDGTNGFYGADFIVEDDVVLVTINYRLGPWGFASFDIEGYTGNMGFKDQQMALEWIHRNIRYFGGDPNLITVFGESAGGAAVHLHMLSSKSRKLMKRAIPMSGSAFTTFANYPPNNHVELFKETFALDAGASGHDVLQFLLDAPVELILEKTPVITLDRNVIGVYFASVIEDPEKAENPFLTRSPREVYRTSYVNVDAMIGGNTAEFIVVFNPADPYSWIEPMRNYSNIGLPFTGLTLSPDSPVYREAAEKIYKFYFGDRELEPTVENLDTFLEMGTDMNFIYPAYQSLKFHSAHANTFCYLNDLTLNLNAVKITGDIEYLDGMAHFEDLQYLFWSKKYAQLYHNVLANPTDPINQKTIRALNFVPKLFTNFAKKGRPTVFGGYSDWCKTCILVTNEGPIPMFGLRRKQMEFWDQIYDSVKPWIVNPF
uniref:Carboxylic ester hydrolase n=1 Tax=Bradysia odoriphaga TaxID=1564500 RepID=A0A9E9L758_9DIPT|nr:carboxylesterase [Bradysia odoriphaga]